MVREFKAFLLRGSVVDLAVGIVIGAAFGAVVTALVRDLITPIIAAIIGKPDFSNLMFTINGSTFHYGDFINVLIAFISIAAAVFAETVTASRVARPPRRDEGVGAQHVLEVVVTRLPGQGHHGAALDGDDRQHTEEDQRHGCSAFIL